MTVYCKTPIGQQEIQSRAHPLPAKTRQALILVDGKREDHLLCNLIADAHHTTLDTLLDLGLIEPSKAVPLDIADEASPQRAASKPPSLEALRFEAVRALHDALGPEAELMALRIEKVRDAQQLHEAIDQAAHLVRSVRGDDAGIAFAARLVG